MICKSAQFSGSRGMPGQDRIPATTASMEQDRTWNVIALKLAGKASQEEWAELQVLIEGKPENVWHLQALTNFWHQHSKYDKERIEIEVKKIAENYAQQNQMEMPPGGAVLQNRDQGADVHKIEFKKGKRGLSMVMQQLKNCFLMTRNKLYREKLTKKTDGLSS